MTAPSSPPGTGDETPRVLRAITVQQPWAWAIVHGGKGVENRGRPTSHRGPVAIHAGSRFSMRGSTDSRVKRARSSWRHTTPGAQLDWAQGAVIGVADLVDCHPATDRCCAPWGDQVYMRPGDVMGPCFHLVLANPRPLAEPVPARGALPVPWLMPPDVARAVSAASSPPRADTGDQR